jgi:asparagine synthase (glutamine-hydrolysing)
MAWGLEARVPFLDKEFLEVSMNIRPEDKTFGKGAEQQVDAEGHPVMEKYILRKAFDISPDGGRVSFNHLFFNSSIDPI